jgi:2-haloacid dehalogenase
MIKVILWDMDATLLDFLAAEHAAIKFCFQKHGLGECTDEMIGRYSKINRRYWEMLERGEMEKQKILVERFREFFEREGLVTDCAEDFNASYQIALGDTICFQDDSYELVKKLNDDYRQFIVTNGTFVAQERKLKKSGFGALVEAVFISELIGHEKPSAKFFDHVFEKIGIYEKNEIMIVGDSLTSDMMGGNNAGIVCCWYNPNHLENTKNVKVDYEIDHLWKIEEILKKHE